MGGVWQRVIRSVHNVNSVLLKEQSPNNESLASVMREVDAILKSRPLTKISDDPSNMQVLMSDHLLLLRAGPECTPQSLYKCR